MKRALVVGILSAACCAPAAAHEPPPLGGALFSGIVRDSDVDLVFDYLRESARAALEGREAPVPNALANRAEQMTDELKRRGGIAARILMDVLERNVREAMREAPPHVPALSPSYPSGRRI